MFCFTQSPLICKPRELVPSVLNPVDVSTTNTPMNRTHRRLEENIDSLLEWEAQRFWGHTETAGLLGVFQGLGILEGGLKYHYLYY